MNTVVVPRVVRALFTEDEAARLIELRRDLHAHPELSWKEARTQARLEDALRASGIDDLRRIAGTGLVARIPGRVPGAPVIALRGDIDALPIHEATGLPFASHHEGVMHACGHDVHAAWAAGAALLLQRTPADGDVLVVFQPAEEVGQGASRVLDSGALDGVRAIFGGHVDRRFEVGQVVAQPGPLAASSDSFTITLTGAGAHGARPHESADPVVGLAALVSALQTIVSRRLDPAQPGVVTVGMVQAGTAPNIIPESAELRGTVRATTAASRDLIVGEVDRLSFSVAAAYRLEANVVWGQRTPPVVNSADGAAWAREAAATVLGAESVVPLGTTNMGGEDFAFYLERLPGCFLRIGAREPGGEVIAAHSPRFHPAEDSLFIGAAVLAECARVASRA
ncbi:MAG: M20 family metallopeptidase [Gemmatimonadota bacterium]|nr:M20 family metallopeptidase [Gemmatimonadota bacterium]